MLDTTTNMLPFNRLEMVFDSMRYTVDTVAQMEIRCIFSHHVHCTCTSRNISNVSTGINGMAWRRWLSVSIEIERGIETVLWLLLLQHVYLCPIECRYCTIHILHLHYPVHFIYRACAMCIDSFHFMLMLLLLHVMHNFEICIIFSSLVVFFIPSERNDTDK